MIFLFYIDNGMLCVLIKIAPTNKAILLRIMSKKIVHIVENRKNKTYYATSPGAMINNL